MLQTPMVYFHHKNGSFIAPDAAHQGLTVYYTWGADEGRVSFPKVSMLFLSLIVMLVKVSYPFHPYNTQGFRMIAGAPNIYIFEAQYLYSDTDITLYRTGDTLARTYKAPENARQYLEFECLGGSPAKSM